MSADPFKTLRDRQLEHQAEPVVFIDPGTGQPGSIPVQLSGSNVLEDALVTVTDDDTTLGSIPAGATSARIEVRAYDVRFRVTGDDVDGSNYSEANQGDTILLDHRSELEGFKAVRVGDSSAILYVVFHGSAS